MKNLRSVKRNGLYIALMVSLFVAIEAQSAIPDDVLPWNENGACIAENISKNSDHWAAYLGPKSIQHFVDRYGAKPSYLILDDLNKPVRMNWDIGFRREWNSRFEAALWGRELVWGDIQKYFYWRFESAKTDSVFFVPITYGDPADSIQAGISWGHWFMNFSFDASELPIPNDGSAYRMTVEAHVGDPVDGNGVKFRHSDERYWPYPNTIARSTLQTPLDYYVQAFVVRSATDTPFDKETLFSLLKDFPYDQRILQDLVGIYYEEKKPDSLRWAGKLFLKSVNEDLDEIVKDLRGDFQKIEAPIEFEDYMEGEEEKTYLEHLQDMLFELDGDTTLYK
jgi:hypothetical protein